ncbi:MAG: nucleoside triphosphate pyrophosphohydrolase [Proteobacteria bacterium]|nr:nucleoside triphosphate pyrophosphohydrolase [Pseudomonadota bacterium]
MSNKNATIDELLSIMATLRDPVKGCPWDKKQTMATIVPHTIEEAYEVADAIENGTTEDIKSELADLLLQIIYYCQIGKEEGKFDFADIVNELKDKLIRRHPHIFNNENVPAQEHSVLWEAIKEKERQQKPQNTVLSGIAHNLPALLRAQKLQARAATVGFDWPHITFVLDKIHEEIEEFKESYAQGDFEATQEELGDVLFVCANLARHVKSDAETILRKANGKFERRFSGVEQRVVKSGKPWQDFSLEELDAFWDEVKAQE